MSSKARLASAATVSLPILVFSGTIGSAEEVRDLAALGVAGLLLAFFDVKARREEAWLVAAYPGYAAYRRRVRKLVPLVY